MKKIVSVKSGRGEVLSDYAQASGCSTGAARSVKSQIYSSNKLAPKRADCTGSASALTAQSGAVGEPAEIVPQKAQLLAPVGCLINNMRENPVGANEGSDDDCWVSICDEDFGEVKLVVTDSGKTKTQLVRKPSSTQACMIDWCNFSVLEDTFFKTAHRTLVADEEIVEEASVQLEMVFGFGITTKRDRGLNFYRESWVLGDGMGFVCFGGQRQTLMVVLNGQGCQHALAGWEKRLFDFLTKVAVRPSLSRIDLAHDDIEGAYLSVDWADLQWSEGGFTFKKGGRPCDIRHLGNWKRPTGKGRTVTMGLRSSSKFCRFYEKGKMEGDKDSLWCRCEIEFKNSNTVINFDVLLNPTPYFVGAYPCISLFANVATPRRMDVKKKAAQISFDTAVAITKHQFGRYIRAFRGLFDTEKQLLDAISHADEGAWPKRLRPFLIDATSGPLPVHKQIKLEVPDYVPFSDTVPSFGLNGGNGFFVGRKK